MKNILLMLIAAAFLVIALAVYPITVSKRLIHES
jgi:hypothetical protein